MIELINKILRAGKQVVILVIVMYGSIYASSVCCNAVTNTCSPTSVWETAGHTNSNICPSSHHRNRQLRSNHLALRSLADFGSDNSCCASDSCDRHRNTTYFKRPNFQHYYPLKKNLIATNSDNLTKPIFKHYRPPTSLKVFPIYIMTQAFIC